MKLEKCNVVIQGLAVVVVVYVGGGHPEGLGAGAPELLCEVVVAHTDIDGIARTYNAEMLVYKLAYHIKMKRIKEKKDCLLGDAVSSCEDPGLADEGASAQVLVEAVDEGHLPAPLPRRCVLPTHHPPTPVRPLHSAHVLVRHRVHERWPLIGCWEGVRLVRNHLMLGVIPAGMLLLLLPEPRRLLPLGGQAGWRLPKGTSLPLDPLVLLLDGRLGRTADCFLFGTAKQI